MAVPIQHPQPPSPTDQAVERMEAEHRMLADERYSGWAVVWTLFGFKIGTIAIIMILGSRNSEAGSDKWWAYIISSTWYWFIIPVVALSGLIAWRLRLRKVRRQVSQLRQSEFSVVGRFDLAPLSEEEKARLRQVRRSADFEQ